MLYTSEASLGQLCVLRRLRASLARDDDARLNPELSNVPDTAVLRKWADGADLKAIMTSPGVWRIRRSERSPIIELTKVADHGTGNVISENFLKWREGLVAREVAQLLR
jgi:hypothetical protein